MQVLWLLLSDKLNKFNELSKVEFADVILIISHSFQNAGDNLLLLSRLVSKTIQNAQELLWVHGLRIGHD